ncbi:MAG: ABC transporter permease [Candidatus Latescibacterota bacterium]|nr:ABC transporter permease [Candidatus Latescibacterota bacterium]
MFHKAVEQYGISFSFVAMLLLVWEFLVHWTGVADYLLPPPTAIFTELWLSLPLLLRHAAVTLTEAVLGFLLGASTGITCAILMARSRVIERMLSPLVITSQTFPKEALAPVFLIWFGFGIGPKVIIAGLISFFPVVVNTTRGLLSVDPLILDLMRSLSAAPLQIFTKVRFPNAVPYIFAALKICVTLSVIGAVVGELVGSSAGLGYLVKNANSDMRTDRMFAALILLGVMGTSLYLTVEIIERGALKRWGGTIDTLSR